MTKYDQIEARLAEKARATARQNARIEKARDRDDGESGVPAHVIAANARPYAGQINRR